MAQLRASTANDDPPEKKSRSLWGILNGTWKRFLAFLLLRRWQRRLAQAVSRWLESTHGYLKGRRSEAPYDESGKLLSEIVGVIFGRLTIRMLLALLAVLSPLVFQMMENISIRKALRHQISESDSARLERSIEVIYSKKNLQGIRQVNPCSDPMRKRIELAARSIVEISKRREEQVGRKEQVDLRGADLRCLNLVQIDFGDAKLTDALLSESNLTSASLEGSDLMGARLVGAHLGGANLIGARLTNASLEDSNLTEAQLVGSRLDGANLRNARIDRADLRDALGVDQGMIDDTKSGEGALLPENLNRGKNWPSDEVVSVDNGR